jgi:hypothetical protein
MIEFTLFLLQALILMLVIPGFMLLSMAFWCWILFSLDEKCREADRRDHLPQCDINPLFHPAFVWAADGNGYICGMLVVRR